MTEPMPMPPPEKTQESVQKRQSKGEKLFDIVVYGPMNMIGTFLLTIPVAWSMEHGVARGFYRTCMKGLTKLKFSEEVAGNVTKTTALMMGGNLMLLPVRGAENNKEDIVAGINRAMGETKTQEKVVSEPQQDWASLGKSRLVAWGVVFATFTGLAKWAGTELQSFEHSFADKMCDRFGWAKQKTIMENGTAIARETRAYGYSRIAALDVFATIAAGVLLYVGSRFFAKKRDEKIEYRATHPEAQRHRLLGLGDRAAGDRLPETSIAGLRQSDGVIAEAVPEREAAAAR